MNYILFDPPDIERYYPFALTRPLGEMRVFGGTIKDIWEDYLGKKISYLTRDYLSDLYPLNWELENNILIPSDCLLDKNIMSKTLSLLEPQNKLLKLEQVQAKCPLISKNALKFPLHQSLLHYLLSYKYDCNTSNIDCSKNIFLNDEEGPIIIEDDVHIMEGASIKGPVYISKGSVIKMGAKIYGPTIIGPYCKIGGEVSNCIFLGFSNKAHEGFLGHSIIGEWCNIGAGTSNSNLKNDYGNVKLWDYLEKKFKDSQEQFLGLYMGDHSKCAINTSFNTGTTVGVNCNIFGAGFPRNFISSFSWGGAQGFKPYNFKKALSVVEKVMERRGITLTSEYINMFKCVYDITLNMKY